MIDLFAIGLTHVLLALAALRLAMRADCDNEKTRRFVSQQSAPAEPPEGGRDA